MGTKIRLKHELFQAIRKLKDWESDADLAKAMQVDRSTVHRNLKRDTVSLDFVANLLRALDKRLDVDDLFEEDSDVAGEP